MPQTPKYERQSFFQSAGPDNSAAQVAQGLSQALESFSNVGFAAAETMNNSNIAEKKQIAAINQAHVNSAVEDMEINIDYAKQKFKDDPEGFIQYTNKSSNGTLSAMPEELRPQAMDAINKTFGLALNEVVVAFEEKNTSELIVTNASTIEDAETKGANAALKLDMTTVNEQRNRIKESMPDALYSKEERKAALDVYDDKTQLQNYVGNAFKIYNEQGSVKAFEAIQHTIQNGIKGIEPERVTQMSKVASAHLNNQIKLTEDKDKLADAEIEAKQAQASDELLTQAALTHTNPELHQQTKEQAQQALASNKITYPQYSSIMDEINAPKGHDDIITTERIYTDLYADVSPEQVDTQINTARAKGLLTVTKATELRRLNQNNKMRIRSGQGTSVFQKQTSQAFNILKIKLNGSSIIEKIQGQNKERTGNALKEFHERIAEAEIFNALETTTPSQRIKPMDIADDIGSRFSTETVSIKSFPKTRFGSKNSEAGVTQAKFELYENKDKLSAGDYRREVQLLQDLTNFWANKELEVKSNAK